MEGERHLEAERPCGSLVDPALVEECYGSKEEDEPGPDTKEISPLDESWVDTDSEDEDSEVYMYMYIVHIHIYMFAAK